MTPPEAARIVRELYDIVWSAGELSAIDRLVAAQYVMHSDPGDPWEGRTLDRATYRERVMYSRTGFPDLIFMVHEIIPTEHRVSVRRAPRAPIRAISWVWRRPGRDCALRVRRSMRSFRIKSPVTGR